MKFIILNDTQFIEFLEILHFDNHLNQSLILRLSVGCHYPLTLRNPEKGFHLIFLLIKSTTEYRPSSEMKCFTVLKN